MNVQIDLNDEDEKLFTTMATKRGMTLPELMHYCTMKQAAREYSFVVADEEDLERKLQEGWASVTAGRTYPAEEVFARLRMKLPKIKSPSQKSE